MVGGRRGRGQFSPARWAQEHQAAHFVAGDGRGPSFGYFPNDRRRTTFAHLDAQDPPYDYALELRHRGFATLAFEYHAEGSVRHQLQVWTPPVPALTFDTTVKAMLRSIRGRTRDYAAAGTVPTGHPAFDERFTVYCEHPDFARGVLALPLLEWLLRDERAPTEFGLRNSVAQIPGPGALTETTVETGIDFLVDLVRWCPPHTWTYRR